MYPLSPHRACIYESVAIITLNVRYHHIISPTGRDVFVLLTHVDALCPHVKDDTSNVFRSRGVQNAVRTAGAMFDVAPERVYPVRNYTGEADTDWNTDIMCLSALWDIIK